MDIQSLHQDILLHIFHAVALNEPPQFMHVAHLNFSGVREMLGFPITTRDERLGWVRLGHVNHAWRAILLRAQTLWADHIGSLPAGVDEMLARAGRTAPVTLRLPLGTSSSPIIEHLVEVLLDRGVDIQARLRAVHTWYTCPFPRPIRLRQRTRLCNEIDSLKNDMKHIWYEVGNQLFPFSVLESTLLVNELATLEILNLSRHCTSPRNRLSVNAPNLRHLTLRDCYVSCPRSTQLVSISISFLWHIRDDTPGMTMDEILDLLECCAATLQHLDLNGVFLYDEEMARYASRFAPPAHVLEPSSERSINLPALRSISLQETYTDTACFLTHLCYPQSTTTRFTGRRGPAGSRLSKDIDLSIRAAIAKYPDCHAVGLYFHDEHAEIPTLQGSIDIYALPTIKMTSVHMCSWFRTHSPIIRISAEYTGPFFHVNAWTVARTLASELPTSGIVIEEVVLSLGNSISQNEVLDVLRSAPRARNLYIETQSITFTTIAHAVQQHITEGGHCYEKICLVAGSEPTTITNLATMSTVFGQSRFDVTTLCVDKEFERTAGVEKMRGFVDELHGAFKEIVLCECKV
ncbi:hypothetical protein PENSPDRAFT_646381 [Peniophora sp. CONT]|nr:hypothetical protein PENSPDRAFT_646381 [Peniophora sp. CONT]